MTVVTVTITIVSYLLFTSLSMVTTFVVSGIVVLSFLPKEIFISLALYEFIKAKAATITAKMKAPTILCHIPYQNLGFIGDMISTRCLSCEFL